ncbi:MAG: hypothetical protein NZM29_02435 [Nitrospira sp.]|nr:hypothetical protein [Nitrospira sp.]
MALVISEPMNSRGAHTVGLSSANEPSNHTCTRCGGLLVSHLCVDLLNTGCELEFAALRCVQCGDIVDPVILHNRRLGQNRQTVEPGNGTACHAEWWAAA